jgi:hypothetical protein
LLSLRLFELRVNMFEHAAYITEAPKPRSPCAGPIMCSSSCVLLHFIYTHNRDDPPIIHGGTWVTVTSGTYMTAKSSYHRRLSTRLIGTRYLEEFTVVTSNLVFRHARPSYSSPASHISKCYQRSLLAVNSCRYCDMNMCLVVPQ